MTTTINKRTPNKYEQIAEQQRHELLNARMIQEGLLPKKRHFNRVFDESFILFKPLNIISGDFYWVGRRGKYKYLVVGDCTGHGISAALLSVLAINLFQYAIMTKGLKQTDQILKEVDRKFIESFKSSKGENFDNPWIDLSIVRIDEDKEICHYSSANRKLLLISEEEMVLKTGNRYPIGGWQLEKQRNFEPQTIPYKKGDLMFLGSDGFQDQFGGEARKRYKSKKLHSFLYENRKSSLADLRQKLNHEFEAWKSGHDQVDDVCIVGVRL